MTIGLIPATAHDFALLVQCSRAHMRPARDVWLVQTSDAQLFGRLTRTLIGNPRYAIVFRARLH